MLKQRIKGVKNEKGIWITPAFPKLIYVLEENNIEEKEGGKLDISKNEENGEGKNNTENKCKICEHKEREKIEYLFDSGMEVNYLSKRFNVSVGGLNTHLTSHRKAPPGELE